MIEGEIQKSDEVEAPELDSFSINVLNLSYIPPRRIGRQIFDYARIKLAPLNLGWMFPTFKDTGRNSGSANLYNVNFKAKGGKITAILGKKEERRELVDLLVGRKKSGTFDGDVCMRGAKITKNSKYLDNVAFVQRKPLYIPGLTYVEMLRYAAKLKMKDKSMGVEDRINDLINVMDLNKCRNRVIPEYPALRGEVGCDMRRLSIALEIVDLPPLIVIDEPTLNFDPAMSVHIINCLHTLAKRGHCIVLSMTKPFLQEFAQLDSVCLLSEGFTIYTAPPKYVEEYFCSQTMGYELKKGVDLVEFVLDIASGIERPTTQRAADLPAIMLEKFEDSSLFDPPKQGDVNISAFSPDFFKFYGYARFDSPAHIVYRTIIVIIRAIATKFKDYEALQTGLLGCSIISTLCGYLQYNQGSYGNYCLSLLHFPYLNTANLSSLFFFVTAFTFAFPFTNTHIICQKLQLFRYEQSSGYCTIAAFALASVISEIPFQMFFLSIFISIVYFMANLAKGEYNYFFFWGTVQLNGLIGLTSAYLLSSIFRKELVVRDVFFVVLTIIALLSGFPFQLTVMTDYLADAAVVNPLRWTFEALMQWKFSKYGDGTTWLTTYGFEKFNHDDIFNISKNFLLIANSVTILFLISEPVLLKKKNIDGKQRSFSASRDSLGSFDTSHLPRPSQRTSELVKPLLFMRESSVTGRNSKLSINLSQVGEENNEHGPTVMFKDVTYRIRDAKSPVGYKTILNRVSGQFDWGKLSMIMGAPESGKTSLIHILAGDNGLGTEISGRITYNNIVPDPNMPLWQRCGFVPMQCEHLRDLTAKEVITFAMKLRCLNRLGLSVVAENVQKTIEILHLEDIVNKKTKKLTPGELKRLSIAEEMVHGPKLLLIDEPTTGVNLHEASVLLLTFREMVNQDRTVVATIHQPSAEIFKLFDTLLLLSKGRVIYFGTVNGATKYFINSPFQFNYSNYTNPADYLADISGGFITDYKGEFIDSSLLENNYMQSETYSKLRLRFKPNGVNGSVGSGGNNNNSNSINPLYGRKAIPETSSVSLSSNPDADGFSVDIDTQTPEQILQKTPTRLPLPALAIVEVFRSFCRCLTLNDISDMFFKGGILFHRAILALGNRIELLIASVLLHICLACMFGWIIGDASGSTGVYNTTSFLAMSSMFLMLANIQFVFYVFNNHQVFLKENARGLYSNFVNWSVTGYPLYLLRLINAVVFIIVAYPTIQLDTHSGVFGFVILSFMFLVLASAIMAEALILAASEMRQPYISIPGLAFTNFLFSGLFIKPGSLPDWLAPWAPSISMIRWNMQGCFIDIYENSGTLPTVGDYSTYTAFLQLFGWGGKTKWYCFYMLLANIAFFRILSLIAGGLSAISQKGGSKKAIRPEIDHNL